MNQDELWGKIVFNYTRADALRDGVLLDISTTAQLCAQLQIPTAVTVGLWEALAPGEAFDARDERVKSVLYGLLFASAGLVPNRIVATSTAQIMLFGLMLDNKPVELKALAHRDETGQPVCTLMLAAED